MKSSLPIFIIILLCGRTLLRHKSSNENKGPKGNSNPTNQIPEETKTDSSQNQLNRAQNPNSVHSLGINQNYQIQPKRQDNSEILVRNGENIVNSKFLKGDWKIKYNKNFNNNKNIKINELLSRNGKRIVSPILLKDIKNQKDQSQKPENLITIKNSVSNDNQTTQTSKTLQHSNAQVVANNQNPQNLHSSNSNSPVDSNQEVLSLRQINFGINSDRSRNSSQKSLGSNQGSLNTILKGGDSISRKSSGNISNGSFDSQDYQNHQQKSIETIHSGEKVPSRKSSELNTSIDPIETTRHLGNNKGGENSGNKLDQGRNSFQDSFNNPDTVRYHGINPNLRKTSINRIILSNDPNQTGRETVQYLGSRRSLSNNIQNSSDRSLESGRSKGENSNGLFIDDKTLNRQNMVMDSNRSVKSRVFEGENMIYDSIRSQKSGDLEKEKIDLNIGEKSNVFKKQSIITDSNRSQKSGVFKNGSIESDRSEKAGESGKGLNSFKYLMKRKTIDSFNSNESPIARRQSSLNALPTDKSDVGNDSGNSLRSVVLSEKSNQSGVKRDEIIPNSSSINNSSGGRNSNKSVFSFNPTKNPEDRRNSNKSEFSFNPTKNPEDSRNSFKSQFSFNPTKNPEGSRNSNKSQFSFNPMENPKSQNPIKKQGIIIDSNNEIRLKTLRDSSQLKNEGYEKDLFTPRVAAKQKENTNMNKKSQAKSGDVKCFLPEESCKVPIISGLIPEIKKNNLVQKFNIPHYSKEISDAEFNDEVEYYFLVHDFLEKDSTVPKFIITTAKRNTYLLDVKEGKSTSVYPFVHLTKIPNYDRLEPSQYKAILQQTFEGGFSLGNFFRLASSICETAKYKTDIDYEAFEELLFQWSSKIIDETKFLGGLGEKIILFLAEEKGYIDRLGITFRLMVGSFNTPIYPKLFLFYALQRIELDTELVRRMVNVQNNVKSVIVYVPDTLNPNLFGNQAFLVVGVKDNTPSYTDRVKTTSEETLIYFQINIWPKPHKEAKLLSTTKIQETLLKIKNAAYLEGVHKQISFSDVLGAIFEYHLKAGLWDENNKELNEHIEKSENKMLDSSVLNAWEDKFYFLSTQTKVHNYVLFVVRLFDRISKNPCPRSLLSLMYLSIRKKEPISKHFKECQPKK